MSEKGGCATDKTGIEVNRLIAIVFRRIECLFKNFGGGAGSKHVYSPGFNCVSYEIVMNNDTVIERG